MTVAAEFGKYKKILSSRSFGNLVQLQLNVAITKSYLMPGPNLGWLQLNGTTTKRYSVTGHLVVELGMVAAEWGNYINILSAGTFVKLGMVSAEWRNYFKIPGAMSFAQLGMVAAECSNY